MKSFADRHRTEKLFEVGTWVYLRLQPYRQITVGGRRPHKLSLLCYGHFQVIERVGPVAYRLALPVAAQIHPVFHVLQLKQQLGHRQAVEPTLPSLEVTVIKEPEPESILDNRTAIRVRRIIPEVLIKWAQLLVEDATWESYRDLVARFPSFDLESRSRLQRGSDDTNPMKASSIVAENTTPTATSALNG